MTDDAGDTIWQQEFSGMNTGYESSLRIDLPIQNQSLDHEYLLRIEPLNESEKPLLIATTEQRQAEKFALSTQYQKPHSLSYVWQSSWQNIVHSWQQMPAFYILLVILFYLAI